MTAFDTAWDLMKMPTKPNMKIKRCRECGHTAYQRHNKCHRCITAFRRGELSNKGQMNVIRYPTAEDIERANNATMGMIGGSK